MDPTGSHRANPAVRCPLVKAEMRAVLMMVSNVLGEQSFQMAFIQRNNVVQQVSSAASHPTLRDAILPWTSEGSSLGNNPGGFHRCDHLEPELLIAIKDQVFVRGFQGERLAQLLNDPSARRMLRDIYVQDASTIVADDEEAVEHAEPDRWHIEEIHRRNRFAMISQEGQPALGPVRISRRSFHPTGDGSLGKFKTEHEEFTMDAGRSPAWVFNDHTEDQFPNLLRRRASSDLPTDSGDQPPVHTKTSPVPADDCFGSDDNEGLLPSRPDPPSDYPEELIEGSEARARMSTLQRDELLTQSKILEKEPSPLAKEANQHSQAESYETKHGQDL